MEVALSGTAAAITGETLSLRRLVLHRNSVCCHVHFRELRQEAKRKQAEEEEERTLGISSL